MKIISQLTLAFMLITAMNTSLSAQEAETSNKTKISVEIDPTTFILNGYGIHVRIQPKNSNHLLLGAGAYAMDVPDLLVDFSKDNKEQGWDVRLNQGYGLFGEYHFTEVNKKWFVGAQLAWQEYKIQKDYFDGESKYSTMLLLATGGYTVQPFEYPVYFKFWGGVGYTDKIDGENTIGNAEFSVEPILLFGALHIGYTFN